MNTRSLSFDIDSLIDKHPKLVIDSQPHYHVMVPKYSPSPLSAIHTLIMLTSQVFTQGELLDGDGHSGDVYISVPPGYNEDSEY